MHHLLESPFCALHHMQHAEHAARLVIGPQEVKRVSDYGPKCRANGISICNFPSKQNLIVLC